MKPVFKIRIILLLALACQAAKAQTYTLNWDNSFDQVWKNGALSRTATNVGGSGITATVNIVKNGGTWQPSVYSGVPTPTKNGDYKTGPYSPPNNLMIALDYSSPADYTDVIITFTPGVFNLSFYLGDIDRYFKGRNDFMDQVFVEGNGGVLPVTFTRYMDDPSFPGQLEFSGNMVQVGADATLSGNCGPAGYPANFDVLEQAGDVRVQFGNTILNSLRIRYGSASGVMANPSLQAIAISNMTFTKTATLPIAAPQAYTRRPQTEDAIALNNNPFTDAVRYTFRSDRTEKVTVHIYNSTGSLILRSEEQVRNGANQMTVPLNGALPRGVYLLEIITPDRKRYIARPLKL